jgi:hypothetical protein
LADQDPAIGTEGWQRLIAARDAYEHAISPHYDEILHQVAHRARTEGSLGKADIGALLLWKRLRADTRWASALMAVSDIDVREATAAATLAVRDNSLSPSRAAKAGRAALTALPGFTSGDALASAVLTAAAPDRMAVYDRRAHTALHSLGITLTHSPGRYSRYIDVIDRLLAHAPEPAHAWTPREMDTALYYLPLIDPAPPSA